MKNKKWKISISLLIALCFIIPSGAVLAEEKNEAGVSRMITEPEDSIVYLGDGGPISQEPGCPSVLDPKGIFDPDFGPIVGGPHNGIPEGTYDLWTEIFIPDYCGPGAIKAFLEVYKKCCGLEVIMYETSFEDNFDIYNNWIQIDADCGVTGGQYDSFTWTDARASDGDHSFKCSMYDIYKGNQDDYLECTRGFDISDQDGVNVSFDIWVDGQMDQLWGGYYCVFDYFDYEVYNHGQWMWQNPSNFLNPFFNVPANQNPPDLMRFLDSGGMFWLDGAYKFGDTTIDPWPPGGDAGMDYTPKVRDLGGGWWHVWHKLKTSDYIAAGGDPTDFRFRFSWHSDPENQFEGAYVDNVIVISDEICEIKVDQFHTQGPVEWEGCEIDYPIFDWCDPIEEGPDVDHDGDPDWYIVPDGQGGATLYINFPRLWDAINYGECGQKETCYDFKLWFELVDGEYINNYDWPCVIDIPVCVGDYYDCWVYNGFIETSFGGDIVIPVNPDPVVCPPVVPPAPPWPPERKGEMTEGDDMHITGWAHLQGTVPVNDVPVTLNIWKKYWDEVYFTDFESGSMGWEFGSFGDPSTFHITDEDSWSPTHSLACFNKNTMHYNNGMYYDYALHQESTDVRDFLELELAYYTKFISEGPADHFRILMFDPPYLLSHGSLGSIGFPSYGYHPTWMGPNQPMCEYATFDMMYYYNFWYNVRGMFRNADGSQDFTNEGFGFACFSDATGYTNPQAELDGEYWSGFYFDDVLLKGLAFDQTQPVYTDAIIIPTMEPSECYEIQFEWEDVPYCQYLIRMDCEADGGCDNWEYKIPWDAQVLVTGNKEKMHPKEVESIDLTGSGGGEWSISSSDYDNYIATNSDIYYVNNMNTILELCPDNDGECGDETGEPCCLDATYAIDNSLPVDMHFECWWDLETDFWGNDYVVLEIASGCPHKLSTDWDEVLRIGEGTIAFGGPPYSTGESSYYHANGGLEPDGGSDDGWVSFGTIDCGTSPNHDPSNYFDMLTPGYMWLAPNVGSTGGVDLLSYLDPGDTEFGLRFRMISNSAYTYRGFKLDDVTITNMYVEGFPPQVMDFEDECNDLHNWCQDIYHVGQYWFHKSDRTGNPADIGTYCNFYDENEDGVKDPLESTRPDLEDVLVWTTEIEDCFEAYLHFETDFQFEDGDKGYVEIDDGSGTWWILDIFEGTSGGWITAPTCGQDISFLAGKSIQVRFRLVTDSDAPVACDHWCIRDAFITGKQDHEAPMTTMTMTGTMKESGWYNTAIQVSIKATDNVAMGEIHYIIDGNEVVVAGDTATFTISSNGQHTLEFWGVDLLGNAEAHHIVPAFKIDSGTPPTVSITAPEPGLYLFGNKLLSASKVFVIGAFNIEATAADTDSGIYRVSFYLDGDLIAEDTEQPFGAYCALKHMGAGTIKAIAEDFAQNTAEDTLDVTYYKFL